MTAHLTAAEVAQAAARIAAGGLVGLPTETVYGLAADALDPDAVAAVFRAKGRPASDPLIVHFSPGLLGTDPLGALLEGGWVAPMPSARTEVARRLADRFWPGPLTLVLPRGPRVLDSVTAGGPEVAVRVPAHPVALAVIDALGRPVVAPSANRFGRISPTTAEAVIAELGGRIDAVLDGGPCEVGVESTVVRVGDNGALTLLRPGAFDKGLLGAAAGDLPTGAAPHDPASPGHLPSHYAPGTPLVLSPARAKDLAPVAWDELRARAPARLGWLSWLPLDASDRRALDEAGPAVTARALTPDGSSATAARSLYAALRALDDAGLDLLVVEQPPEQDALGTALADRLRRAAHGTPPLGKRSDHP